MDHNLCVLIDFDNIAKGSRQEGLGEFDIRLVMRRLKDIGRVLVARAYCDWERWSRHRKALAEQGVTMVELVATGHGDKNRGDIALAVDAMEMAYTRDFLDTFVILSGDSDFTPLVQRLKELNRSVIGIGTRGSTSRLIANVCDEFFFYDTLVNRRQPSPEPDDDEDNENVSSNARPTKLKIDHAFALLVETLENHARDEAGPVHASIVKTSMKRKLPTFSETELGFHTFARFMERAQAEGLVTLARDERAGGYRVELAPGPGEVASPPPTRRSPPPQAAPVAPPEPPVRPVGASHPALELLQNEGLDIGSHDERVRILDAFAAACTERNSRGRRLAVQYLQGDLVQQGLDAERVKGVLQALVRIGALLHPDGDAVRTPTAPIQAPAAPEELNALLEERALEVLGEKRMKLTRTARELLFGNPENAQPPREEARRDDGPRPEYREERRDEAPAREDAEPARPEAAAPAEAEAPAEDRAPRRRRSRGGRGRGDDAPRDEEVRAGGDEPAREAAPAAEAVAAVVEPGAAEGGAEAPVGEEADAGPRRRSRRGGRRSGRAKAEGGEAEGGSEPTE